jgi:hypothetical protein
MPMDAHANHVPRRDEIAGGAGDGKSLIATSLRHPRNRMKVTFSK